MNPQSSRKQSYAFTLIEMLVVIAMIAILAVLIRPPLGSGRGKMIANRIKCVNNLKQVGQAFRNWSGEYGEKFPMQMVVTNGELIEPAFGQTPADLFQVMSNHLITPKILICPADVSRSDAINFTNLSNLQVSYFLGLNATETEPTRLLTGDRNITNGFNLGGGIVGLTTSCQASWTTEIHNSRGNIGFADGSVQELTTGNLRKAVQATGLATNRLAMP